jgi:asparagine synthase (glutamine-hydrolysing)
VFLEHDFKLMCGITGFINNDERSADRELLVRMNEAIAHRGPDDDGFYVNGKVGLAMRRLAIIDLAGGKQPIHNADSTKWIVFNGEIYNYQELRKDLDAHGHRFYTNSDTEAIIHLYDEYGPDCLQYLRGMFAFAIWDEADRSLFLARDRVGKKPLLYSHQPNGDLVFGSEFQALLQHPSISRDVDFEAIDSYLSFLCIPAPQTAFKQIRKLEPGHYLRWKSGQIETRRYWLPDFSKKIKISEQDAIDETTRILRESTRLRLISEVPLGAFLSGGVDSSTVVALMAQESDTPVKTFSIGFEEQDFSELKYARIVADHVGAEYNEFIVKPNALEILPTLVQHYGEPYADSSAVPTYYVAKETRKHVTVALNGDGGDESFAGYERHAAMLIAERYRRIPEILRRALVEAPINAIPTSELKRSRIRDAKRFLKVAQMAKTERYFRWMSGFDRETKSQIYAEDFSHAVAGQNASEYMDRWFAKANGSGILDATLLNDLMTYLPNDLLVKVDIATMANSLEARSPFLDHELIEFAARLPENLKMRGFRTKSLLKKVASRLVPKEVIYRRKMGFGVPVGKWFRGEMKSYVKEILLSERALKRGIILPDAIERYVTQHITGERDHAFKLWSLLMLELWFREFIDRA